MTPNHNARHDETNGNGNNLLAGMPPWMRFISIIGPVAAIALFLVWRLDARLGTQLDRMEQRLEAHAAVTSATSTAFSVFAADSRAQTTALVILMRQVCINTAQSAEQRRECVR